MAEFKIPVFESGTVLTQEMLESLKGYAVDFGNLSYTDYSDGILSGCRVTMSGNMLYVGSGMIMFSGNLYFIPEGMSVMIHPGKHWQILRFQVGNLSRDKNFLIGELQLELVTEQDISENQLEICRFRLQNGAMLRNDYRDFNDLNTEFDTVNEIYAQWSGYCGKTIANRILVEFAKEARKRNATNPQDMLFIQQILNLNGKTMSREVILYYLSTRLNRPYQEMTNVEIYKALCQVLQICRRGTEGCTERTREVRRMIVD